MTETEKILTHAEDIARRSFEQPSETTVMQIFMRLCQEQDTTVLADADDDEDRVMH